MRYIARFVLSVFLGAAVGSLIAQPENDLCSRATPIAIGSTLHNQYNTAASITAAETPLTQPNTCIKSFENDVWYSFSADVSYSYYEIVITPFECSSPAGLQALIIEADDCSATNFRYRACANPYKDDNLRLFLTHVIPAKRYLIYVDGYDGTACGFSIQLIGHTQPFADFERLQHDYTPQNDAPRGETSSELSLQVSYKNNEMQLAWQDNTQSSIRGYVIEHMQGGEENRYGAVIGRIAPQQSAGGGVAFYTFLDTYTPFEENQTHCYRLVRVGADSTLVYSAIACADIEGAVKTFWISPVYEDQQQPKTFVIQYDNKRKQTLTFKVFDQNKKVYKDFSLPNEPKGPNTLTIDMRKFPAGTYYLEVCGKDGCFTRAFDVK